MLDRANLRREVAPFGGKLACDRRRADSEPRRAAGEDGADAGRAIYRACDDDRQVDRLDDGGHQRNGIAVAEGEEVERADALERAKRFRAGDNLVNRTFEHAGVAADRTGEGRVGEARRLGDRRNFACADAAEQPVDPEIGGGLCGSDLGLRVQRDEFKENARAPARIASASSFNSAVESPTSLKPIFPTPSDKASSISARAFAVVRSRWVAMKMKPRDIGIGAPSQPLS